MYSATTRSNINRSGTRVPLGGSDNGLYDIQDPGRITAVRYRSTHCCLYKYLR